MMGETSDHHRLRSLQDTIRHLQETDALLTTDRLVDPEIEIIGLQKHFDGGHALLFTHVKGYEDSLVLTNPLATRQRMLNLFEADSWRNLKMRFVKGLRHPLAPRLVEDAPVQEKVVSEDLDVWPMVPMVSHSHEDPGRTLGGGVTLVSGRHFWGGTHVAFNRMNFRTPTSSSFQISPGSHGDMIATEWYRKEPIPMTINIGVPLAVAVTAASGFDYMVMHKGSDELGVAGRLQGYPVDVVRAKTVDALAIAEAQWVIEGYLETSEKTWESPLAEADGQQGKHPFHPEWAGYMGKAYRTYTFHATAVTHRAERPIYHALGVHMEETHNMVLAREAALYEIADRVDPGLCTDVSIPWAMTDFGGAVFQVRKRRARDEGVQINILDTVLASSRGMRLAMAVDDDIDIDNLHDIMWAFATRVNPATDLHRVAIGGAGQAFQPSERASAGAHDWTAGNIRFPGGLSIDATVPIQYREDFARPRYPVSDVNPFDFFPAEDVERGKASQTGWSPYLAETGY